MNISKKVTIFLVGLLFMTAMSALVSAAEDDPFADYPYDSAAAAGFMGMALLTCAIFAIVWLVVWILVAIWVYKDANKRGKSGVLWLIIVILLGLVGLIIWLVVRGEKTGSSRKCPNCGRDIPEDARSCPYCNKKFEE